MPPPPSDLILKRSVSLSIYGVLWITTLQHTIPDESLSRVSSFDWFGSLSLASLGLLVAGPAVQHTGLTTALTCCATLVLLSSATCVSLQQVRQLRLEPLPAPSTPPLPPAATSN
jgi:hypothetical protein